MKTNNKFGLSALVLSSVIGATAFAQSSAPASSSSTQATGTTSTSSNAAMSPSDSSTYATGKPLEMQSKEGFWGHVNPFARKKWVSRQVDPIKDRTNELDQLQAKNANDIKDVDSRSQAGISKAMLAANTADQHAMDANNRATQAGTVANSASTRTDSLNNTVGNLDQYKPVTATTIPFAAGRTTLGPTGKSSLDDVAAKLEGEKGYIIEIQGYSRGGVQTSQAMADSVVRYLVTEHQVPIFRIYRTGLGKNTAKSADGEKIVTNGVQVTLLHNSLASMESSTASSSSPSAASAPRTGSSVPSAQ
jgi:outer membrane protein OmpA-like peptidoglycan-associated protein